MKDVAALKARYEQDEPAVRLGGLASNLSRIAWFADQAKLAHATPVFRESKYFAEWAAPGCSADLQGLLAELQVELALWERRWERGSQPSRIAQDAQHWSATLLEASGLLSR